MNIFFSPIHYSFSQSSDIDINPYFVNKLKIVGVYINDKLKFNDHILYITNICSERQYAIRTLQKILNCCIFLLFAYLLNIGVKFLFICLIMYSLKFKNELIILFVALIVILLTEYKT
jgi:hypothetical protein